MSQMLYKEALAAGREKVYNIRVMIVGHQGVGKTSLTQRLLGEQVKENETESTEGIEVHARCCHIDHATQEWQLKVKTDELSLNDQRIANILSKYVSPRNSQAVVEVLATDPENDVTPSTPTAGTLRQGSEAVHIRKTDGIAPISQLNNRVQKENVQEEAQERICSAEIKNLVERTLSLPILKSESSYITFLDFAGQSLFYSTHQAFMSWRTLYLLVTDMSLPLTDAVEEGVFISNVSGIRTCSIKEYVTYWLNSIHSHVLIPEDARIHREEKSTRREEGGAQGTKSNHPFVILVGTHSDKIPEKLLDQKKKSYFNDIRVDMKDRPFLSHLVDEDFAISNLGSDPTINELKSKIFETAQNQLYWGEEIPARWILLERALMDLKKRIPVIEYTDVKSLNETLQVQIECPEELDLFLRFEHDMGNIVFFNTERLRNKVVLDPKWLIHGVRIWITSDHVIKRHSDVTAQWDHFKKTGQLTHTLIEKLWSSHSEIHQHKEHLLDLMEKLNIIVKPLQMEGEYYWVPCMVSIPAPDYIKKLQQKKDTTKTSTLCFRSKTNFIHVGVFHRLIAICLSKWMPAKEGEAYLLFQGLCVFDIDEQQQLLLSLNDFVIHAVVIRFTKQGRIPDLYICMTIRNYLHTALSEISNYLCPGSKFETCIQCNKSSPLTNEGLHSITTLRTKDEIKCSYHKETHCVESGTLLGFWEEVKKQIPDHVKPQQSHKTKETRTGICDSVLRKLSKDLISHKWKFFFRELSVTTNELDEVEINYRNDVHEQIYQLLCHLNKGGRLNKSSIIQALQSVERYDLIDKYSDKDFNLS
ncbi:hypothetical protein CHS0354_009070 [Potamilus streckersoni]|uniref:Death domain-containing protein n=1 Tax=Potamilus streckersoni TaxID=2493646 RepID=A0AAE0THN1_9BIVA|nr:hypothetical protein CHS0354_009070 [Potamilus streckersoni]